MPVSLNCPSGHRLTVSRRYAGKLVRCPKCGEKTRIPPLETIERKLKEQIKEQVEEKKVAADSTSDAPSHPPPPEPPPISRDALAPGPPDLGNSEPGAIAPPIPAPEPPPVSRDALAAGPPDLDNSEPGASAQRLIPAELPTRGYRPEPERRWTCLSLGVSLALIGVFGAAPAVLEIAEYARSDGTVPVARWAWLVLLAAAVQIAYAVYAAQLPDWSTAWVVTLAGAALATLYAFLLGLTLVSGESSSIVTALELTDQLPQGRATRWCFAMLGILGVYSYFAGRSALRWRHTFHMMRPMKEAKTR